MNDGPVDDQLIGLLDDVTGDAELTGWTSGPAGSAGVGLAGGAVQFDVDHALPGVVSSILVEGAGVDPRAHAALDELLDGAWARIRDGLTARPQVVWQPTRHREHGWYDISGPPSITDRLGRFAVLLAEHRERPATATVRAVRLLELAALADELPTRLGVEPAADTLWHDALVATGTFDPDDLAGTTVEVRRQIATWIEHGLTLESAASLPSEQRQWVARAAQLLRSPSRREGRDLMAVSDMAAPMLLPAAGAARPVMAREAREPRPTAGEPVDVVVDPPTGVTLDRAHRRAGHVEATVSGDPVGELWLRVFRPPTRERQPPLLVSLARFRTTRFGSSWAAALLPADLDRSDHPVLVDIVTDVATAWRPPAVRATQAGLVHGRQAAHTERLHGPEAARPHWHRSRVAHDQAGDKRRSSLAGAYAEMDDRRGGTDPGGRRATARFVTDDVESP